MRGTQDLGEHVIVPSPTVGDVLAELDEINGILAGDLFGIKGPKPEEGFAPHVRCQPMPVVVLAVIPEEFLFGADAVDGLDQATGEKIGKSPDDLVHFLVQQFEVRVSANRPVPQPNS